jgi:hypothetical protein
MHLIKENEGQEGKINFFWEWVPVGGYGHKERGKESVYCGYILYPYIKMVE